MNHNVLFVCLSVCRSVKKKFARIFGKCRLLLLLLENPSPLLQLHFHWTLIVLVSRKTRIFQDHLKKRCSSMEKGRIEFSLTMEPGEILNHMAMFKYFSTSTQIVYFRPT